MTCTRFVAVCLLLSMLARPHAASAQTVNDEARTWHEVLEKMEPAVFVALRLKDGTHLNGTVLSVQDTTFTLKPRTRIPVAARDVPYDAIANLERGKIGMSPGKKVLIGVATGAGAIVVLAAVAIASLDD